MKRIIVMIAIFLGGLLMSACDSGNSHCKVITYYPMKIGKINTMQPIYQCNKDV